MQSTGSISLVFSLLLSLAFSAAAADADGFVSLFNGKDLSGWVPVNVAPNTFTVKEGIIVSTGIPTGVMRTERQYENFIIELEWRHMKSRGNAGLFVWGDDITSPGVPFARGIEVQILDLGYGNTDNYTTHGDVFPIHGATMNPFGRHRGMRSFPSEMRSKPSPEWNHYRVVCTNGVVRLSVNGKEVSGGSECNPRKGYICLESEGSECHFRNIRLQELPATGVPAEQTARLDEGFRSLYTGIDLSGWKAPADVQPHWQPKDWTLTVPGGTNGLHKDLWTEREYGDFILIADWKLTAKPALKPLQVILPDGSDAVNDDGTKKRVEVMDAGGSGIFLRGDTKNQVDISCKPFGSGDIYGWRIDPKSPAAVRAAAAPKLKADKPPGQWNRFVITMRGEYVTVELNGKIVVEKAHLPGIARTGPIGLQHHGDAVQFANIYVKELK
jgi:hypothetical protein